MFYVGASLSIYSTTLSKLILRPFLFKNLNDFRSKVIGNVCKINSKSMLHSLRSIATENCWKHVFFYTINTTIYRIKNRHIDKRNDGYVRLQKITWKVGDFVKHQKQSFSNVLQNRCYYKFRKFDRKAPVLESLFNQVADLQTCNFIKKNSNVGVFLLTPVNSTSGGCFCNIPIIKICNLTSVLTLV